MKYEEESFIGCVKFISLNPNMAAANTPIFILIAIITLLIFKDNATNQKKAVLIKSTLKFEASRYRCNFIIFFTNDV